MEVHSTSLQAMNLEVTRLHPLAVMPAYAHANDAGADLVSVEDVTIRHGGGRVLIHTGWAFALPDGFAGGTHKYRSARRFSRVGGRSRCSASDHLHPAMDFSRTRRIGELHAWRTGLWEYGSMRSHPISPLDSAFLTLEVPSTPLQIGAVVELALPENATSAPERFNRVRQVIAERIHEIPVLGERVLRPPACRARRPSRDSLTSHPKFVRQRRVSTKRQAPSRRPSHLFLRPSQISCIVRRPLWKRSLLD